jgi:CO/xanthine dehydrogenase FAD-binding subunit
MTSHNQALILRLAAAIADDEPYSVQSLQQLLLAQGWSEAALASAVAKLRQSLIGIAYTQESLFDKAA